jgi:hypothetical protein
MASTVFSKLAVTFLIFTSVTLLSMTRGVASEVNHAAVEKIANDNASSIFKISEDSAQGSFWWMS